MVFNAGFSSSQCAQASIENVVDFRSRANLRSLIKFKFSYPSNHLPEADATLKLTPKNESYYQSLIGVI